MYFDAIRAKVRDEGLVKNKAVYLGIGVTCAGRKEVLGLWIEQTEGARFWFAVMNELKARGQRDVLIAAVTVCKGFDGAVTVLRGGRELPVRLLGEGEDPSPVEDGKSVRQRVHRAKAEQRSRSVWKPPPDHPCRRPFKPEADGVAAG